MNQSVAMVSLMAIKFTAALADDYALVIKSKKGLPPMQGVRYSLNPKESVGLNSRGKCLAQRTEVTRSNQLWEMDT